jgi:hypothetical protein
MKKAYIVATPSGRSVISVSRDPRKALSKSKEEAEDDLKREQKNYKAKLKVKKVMVSNKIYNQNF